MTRDAPAADGHSLSDPAGPAHLGGVDPARTAERRILDPRFPLDNPQMGSPPYRAICQIRSAVRPLGTGFQVGPSRVLTAAHLFLGMSDAEAGTVKILPPGGEAQPVIGAVFRDTNRRQPGDPEDLVLLDAAGTLPGGALRIGDPAAQLAPPLMIEVSGYPEPAFLQFRGQGPVVRDDGIWLDHGANTEEGHSGAPILAAGADGGLLVVGVQVVGGVAGEVGLPRLANRAIRLAPHLVAWIGEAG